jgi:hypothetical protein
LIDELYIARRFSRLSEVDETEFSDMKAAAIHFQKEHNQIYAAFDGYVHLPVDAFKHAEVCSFDVNEATHVFRSSGTGSSLRAQHFVKDISLYEHAVKAAFTRAFGEGPFVIVGHLPAYQQDSSLVYMVDFLARSVGQPGSGLFLNDHAFLDAAVAQCEDSGCKLILFGAAFGLMDLIDVVQIVLPKNALVIETGGMKTHRREISRSDLHTSLAQGFSIPVAQIRSEYGMCELFSQFYTNEEGLFVAPPWTQVSVVDPENPSITLPQGEVGVLAIFDLANIYSQCALLTQDLGRDHGTGFEVLGRMSLAELRGCNYLFERTQN